MASPTANKRKGAAWETAVRDGFRKHGFDIERLRLNGTEDEGDHYIRHAENDFTVIEAKSGAFMASHWDEAEKEGATFARNRGLDPNSIDPIVIVKRRGKSFEQALVVTSVARYFGLD